MNFSFFFIVTIALIICQTIVLPGFFWFPQCFDLLLIVVLYMSLIYSRYWVIFAILIIGGIMDSISGGAFFLHIFSYLWVFLIVQVFKLFVFEKSPLFMMVVSLAAISIQEGLILFSVFITQGAAGLDYFMFFRQMIWGMIFIPTGVWILTLMHQNYAYLIKMFRRDMARKYRG